MFVAATPHRAVEIRASKISRKKIVRLKAGFVIYSLSRAVVVKIFFLDIERTGWALDLSTVVAMAGLHLPLRSWQIRAWQA